MCEENVVEATEELVGKTLLAIANLPPRQMMGIESYGMLMLDDAIPAGAKLY